MSESGPLAKADRLRIFYDALAAVPAAASMDEAIALMAFMLLTVEDKYSGLPRGDGMQDDGRMYPPRADNRRDVPGRADLARYRSRAHNTYVSSGGAILIVDLNGRAAFAKPGADGKVIEL